MHYCLTDAYDNKKLKEEMNTDFVFSVGISSHFIIGYHAGIGFNFSQFFREMEEVIDIWQEE